MGQGSTVAPDFSATFLARQMALKLSRPLGQCGPCCSIAPRGRIATSLTSWAYAIFTGAVFWSKNTESLLYSLNSVCFFISAMFLKSFLCFQNVCLSL